MRAQQPSIAQCTFAFSNDTAGVPEDALLFESVPWDQLPGQYSSMGVQFSESATMAMLEPNTQAALLGVPSNLEAASKDRRDLCLPAGEDVASLAGGHMLNVFKAMSRCSLMVDALCMAACECDIHCVTQQDSMGLRLGLGFRV